MIKKANLLHISEIYNTESVIFFNSAQDYSQKIINNNNNNNKLISLTIIPLIILLRRCVGYINKFLVLLTKGIDGHSTKTVLANSSFKLFRYRIFALQCNIFI